MGNKIANICTASGSGHEKIDYSDFIDLAGQDIDFALTVISSIEKATLKVHICKHCGCLYAEEIVL